MPVSEIHQWDVAGGRRVVECHASPHNRVLVVADQDQLSVVKIYSDRERFDNERRALRLLSGGGVRVPVLLTSRAWGGRGHRRWVNELSFVPSAPPPDDIGPGLTEGLARMARLTASSAGTISQVRRGRGTSWADFLLGRLDGYAGQVRDVRGTRVDAALCAVRADLRELEPGTISIVHADIRAPNVRWGADGVAGLIDWELARWGDALYDVAVMLHGGLVGDVESAATLYRELGFAGRPAVEAKLATYRTLLELRELALVTSVRDDSLAETAERIRRRFDVVPPAESRRRRERAAGGR